jgi:uncharacterized membrane protein
MKETARFFLSLILLFAGVLHIIVPEVFTPAIFWGHEETSNFVAGIYEIILSFLLWYRPKMGAILSAGWFILLIPIHIYVSLNSIPVFGIDSPALLWARTFFQLPLIWWAWTLRTRTP